MEEDDLKKAGVAILISDKIGFKNVNTDKEGHCIIIKGTIHQEYVAIINTFVPNSKAPKYMARKWKLKGEMDNIQQ